MKKRDLEQAKKLNRELLEKRIAQLKLELKKISVKIASGAENNLKSAKNKKHELAQLLTILRETPKAKETKK